METNVLKTEKFIKNLRISRNTIIVLSIISFVVLTTLCLFTFLTPSSSNGPLLATLNPLGASDGAIDHKAITAVAAGIASISFLGAGIGQGYAAGKAASAVGRNPEAESQIRNMMFVGAAVAESSALYGFVIAIMCLFVA